MAVADIAPAEFQQRRDSLLQHIEAKQLGGFVLFDQHYIRYFTGFAFLATERPVALIVNASGSMAVFVPEFEVERVRSETSFQRVESYPEYPGRKHPLYLLAAILSDLNVRGEIGADQDGYPGILGYAGPPLSEVTGSDVVPLAHFIESMMARKSDAEVELIRESARWCGVAHQLLQKYTRPGVTETQASLQASHEATLLMLEALGPSYRGQQASSDGASAGYRGQIGKQSAWAHALSRNIVFQQGDVLVSETGAPVWGYNAELERAMIIGQPTEETRFLFEHTVAVQQVALDALRPDRTCADVDGAVMTYLEENNLLPYWKQHTGHAIGLRNHEAPFLDIGDRTLIEPGMVFTIEPGLYSSQVGGFRHSDTVLVTPDGIDMLTSYPRDLESLTIPG